jgi:hypothetical protein
MEARERRKNLPFQSQDSPFFDSVCLTTMGWPMAAAAAATVAGERGKRGREKN